MGWIGWHGQVDNTSTLEFLQGENIPLPRFWDTKSHALHVQDRILATCEENDLEYVIDKTNFQPALTLRNAIRHKLSGHQLVRLFPSYMLYMNVANLCILA